MAVVPASVRARPPPLDAAFPCLFPSSLPRLPPIARFHLACARKAPRPLLTAPHSHYPTACHGHACCCPFPLACACGHAQAPWSRAGATAPAPTSPPPHRCSPPAHRSLHMRLHLASLLHARHGCFHCCHHERKRSRSAQSHGATLPAWSLPSPATMCVSALGPVLPRSCPTECTACFSTVVTGERNHNASPTLPFHT